MLISNLEFPDIITIKSSGSAADNQASKMGNYKLETNKTTFLRKVYKKKDRDYYIFFASKFYFEDNVLAEIFMI